VASVGSVSPMRLSYQRPRREGKTMVDLSAAGARLAA
jgi:hypothetical protein